MLYDFYSLYNIHSANKRTYCNFFLEKYKTRAKNTLLFFNVSNCTCRYNDSAFNFDIVKLWNIFTATVLLKGKGLYLSSNFSWQKITILEHQATLWELRKTKEFFFGWTKRLICWQNGFYADRKLSLIRMKSSR